MTKYRLRGASSVPECRLTDVREIVRAFAFLGHVISEVDAWQAWDQHSEDYCAGWLILPHHDDADGNPPERQIFDAIEGYLVSVPD